jgi:hypothetical protein
MVDACRWDTMAASWRLSVDHIDIEIPTAACEVRIRDLDGMKGLRGQNLENPRRLPQECLEYREKQDLPPKKIRCRLALPRMPQGSRQRPYLRVRSYSFREASPSWPNPSRTNLAEEWQGRVWTGTVGTQDGDKEYME